MTKIVSINAKCPHCGKSFMDHENLLHEKPSIKLNIEVADNRGTIRLCSVYDCYDHLCDFELKKGEIAKFYCPDCNKQLISNDTCDLCNAPVIPLIMQIGGKLYFCSRRGCTKHVVAFEDLNLELRKFYHEYGF